MRRIFAFFICTLFVFLVAACGNKKATRGNESTGTTNNVTQSTTKNTTTVIPDKVTVSFNTNGGNGILPIELNEGDVLPQEELPSAYKEGFFYTGWYLDSELEEPYYNGYTFLTDTTLYASYTQQESLLSNEYAIEETTLFDQERDVTFLVKTDGNIVLSNANLDEYVTIASDDIVIDNINFPTLQVEAVDENTYTISSNELYDEYVCYNIAIKEPFYFELEVDQKKITKINFTIAGDNYSEHELSDDIIYLSENDFSSIDFDRYKAYVKTSVLDSKKVNVDKIIALPNDLGDYTKGNNKYSFFKVKSISEVPGTTEYAALSFEVCEFEDIYDSFDFNEKSDLSNQSNVELVSEEEIKNQILNNINMQNFMELSACAISDYAIEHNLANMERRAQFTKPDIDVKFEYIEGDYIQASASVTIDVKITEKDLQNIYARVTISFTHKIYAGVSGYGKFDTLKNWKFDLAVAVDSHTDVSIDVDLYYGTRSNLSQSFKYDVVDIKEDINDILSGETTVKTGKGFADEYKKILKLEDATDINILTVQLFKVSGSLLIFQVSFPVNININVDLNAAFSTSISNRVYKMYGIKGSKGNGISFYEKHIREEHQYDFYYSGHLGIKVGVEIAVDFSFVGLGDLGKIGFSVEIGAFFDFYGYGSMTAFGKQIGENDDEEWSKTVGAYFYEYGIYTQLSMYAKSEIFGKEKSLKYTHKFVLGDGGTSDIVIGFADEVNDIRIVTNEENINVCSEITEVDMQVMNLKTGNVKEKTFNISSFFVVGGYYYRGNIKGNLSIAESFLLNNPARIDDKIELGYSGNSIAISKALMTEIEITYIAPGSDIDPNDNTKYTVKYYVDGKVVHTEKVLKGALSTYSYYDDIDSVLASNPQINNYFFRSTNIPIYGDTEIHAIVNYNYTKITFNYQIVVDTVDGGYILRSISDSDYGHYGQTAADCKDCLVYEDEIYNMADKIVFLDWEDEEGNKGLENIKFPLPGEGEVVVTAIYEMIPFDVTIHVKPLVLREKECISEQIKTITITWGETPKIELVEFLGFTPKFFYNGLDSAYVNSLKPVYDVRDEPIYVIYEENHGCNIQVVDEKGEIIVERYGAPLNSDQTDILQSPEVLAYLASNPTSPYAENVPETMKSTFLYWYYAEELSCVTWDVIVWPEFGLKQVFYKYYFDPGCYSDDGGVKKGEIDCAYAYMASIEGFSVLKSTTLEEEFVEAVTPTIPSDEKYDYVFDGWDKEIGAAYSDMHFTATYKKISRVFDVHIIANGLAYDNMGASIEIEANLDPLQQSLYENLTYAEKENFDIESLLDPIPVNNLYEFDSWTVSNYFDKVEIIAQYHYKDGSAIVEFELGKGSYFDHKGKYQVMYSLPSGNSQTVKIGDYFLPATSETIHYYNNEDQIENISCSYYDDGYYYLPLGWSYDGINVIDDEEEMLIENGETYVLYAMYERKTRQMRYAFEIDYAYDEIEETNERFLKENGEVYEDDGNDRYYRIFYGQYGEEFDTTLVPKVVKRFVTGPEQYGIYEFVFSHWENNSNDSKIIPDTFSDMITFIPVFEKQIKRITITFECDENGIFASNGQKTRTIETNAGSQLDSFGETPISAGNTTYYNYVFDSWDCVHDIVFYVSCTVNARMKAVRNSVKAPNTGIMISNTRTTEDIGDCTMEGYEYNPNTKLLSIYQSGLTVIGDGIQCELSIYIYASDVTIKNMNIKAATDEQAAIYACFYSHESIDMPNITIYVDGYNKIYYEGDGGSAIGDANASYVLIEGISEDAKLDIVYKSTGTYSCKATRLSSIKNVDLSINATIVNDNSFVAIMTFDEEEFAVVDSTISVDVTGEKDDTYYALGIAVGSSYNETILDVITNTGCSKITIME